GGVGGRRVEPAGGPVGTTATMTTVVQNVGSSTAGSFRVDQWFDRNTTPGCGESGNASITIGSLGSGATVSVSATFSFPAGCGSHTAVVFADSQCVVAESSEANNQGSVSYTVSCPDLVVSGMTVSTSSWVVGGAAT